jgi:hypothetical protein
MTSLSGKKVLFYLPSLDLGGSERFGLSLARCFKEQQGADVEVWGVAMEGRLKELCKQSKIPASIVPIKFSPLTPLRWYHLADACCICAGRNRI